MNIKYDKETDIIYLQFTNSQVAESSEEKSGIIIDYDFKGDIVGIEYLDASSKMEIPEKLKSEIIFP